MKIIKIEYPDEMAAVLNLSQQAFENEARMALAAKFYEMGRLTSGQAATLAKISRTQFLLQCSHYGVPSVNWDDDELEAEFNPT